ncbi:HYR-like domain-containing protein [Winogradskyella sp.]|uniref:HYR-like domain-containing protein n=1 Tax=Winogradskyella sp. TaxID=1883156 RepID=UPI003F6AF782
MRNKYNCISVVNIIRAIVIALFVVLPNLLLAQQTPSIQTGITFQWSDVQNNLDDPATIESISINGTIYNKFVVPTSYEMTRLGPDGHSDNKIRLNGEFSGGDSGQDNWVINATHAFQDKNLNHYFRANHNGQDICLDFNAIDTTNAQKQTIFYSPAIPSNSDGVLAITERGGNNCFYIEVWGTPPGGGPEQRLGQTFIRNSGNYFGYTFGPPENGSDYWKSGRCNENGQTIGIGLFFLNALAPQGSKITKIEFTGTTRDHGDGKIFILQKYAVDQNDTNCIDTKYSGNVDLSNNVPINSTYSLVSGPTPAGDSFVFNSYGYYSYTPTPGFTGNVTFEYEVCLPVPNTSVCDQATVTIDFAPLPPEPEFYISCGSTNDNFTISVSSPLGPEFEYSLDNGITFQSSPDFTGLSEGSYNLVVKNIFTDCITFNNNPIVLDNLELSSTTTDVLCRTEATGAIDIAVSGGSSPYSYSWNNGETSEDLVNVIAGNYTVTVTDANGCEISQNFIIYQPAKELTSTGSKSDVLCNGDNTGSIDLNVNGGTAPYSYLWSNGATTEDISNLVAGTYSVTITDANGCTATNQSTVIEPSEVVSGSITNIVDVDCLGSKTGSLTAQGSGGITPYTYSIDNVTTIQASGLFENLIAGDYTVLITDANGCTFTINATIDTDDNTSPEISVPSNLTIEGCSTDDIDSANAVFGFNTTVSGDIRVIFASNPDYNASDDFNINSITYIDVVNSTDNCPITVTRTFTITDNCNNTASAIQIITVQDTTPPILTIPMDVTIECTEDESSNNTGEATGVDTCGDVTITQSDVETAACGNTKTITRTWTATDTCDNITSADQTITVQDTTAPTFTTPVDVTIECDVDVTDLSITGNKTDEADNCDTTLNATYIDVAAAGTCANESIITRTWTLTDDCGNTTTQTQIINVVDTTAPTFTAPNDLTIECDTDATDLSITGDVTDEADNCDNDIDALYKDIVVDGNCPNSFVIMRKWTLIDDCGNQSTAEQIITVQDVTAPTFTVPNDITIECDENTEPKTTGDVVDEGDNCSVDLEATFTDDIAAGNCSNESVITRIWSLTDECGNTTIQTQTINVEDTTAPTFTVPDDITIECDVDATDLFITGDVSDEADNCDTTLDATYSDDVAAGPCANESVIIRTWTLTDDCDNTTTQIQTINVVDTTAPTFTVPADITIECDENIEPVTTGEVTDEVDNCSIDLEATYTDVVATSNCANESIITRTWSLTDECGNTTTLVQIITVQDTTVPTFTTPADVTIECAVDANDLTITGDVSDEADNCDTSLEAAYTDSMSDGSCTNEMVITRTWTLTDDCGNTTTQTQTINVVDTTAPTFTVPSDITIECDIDVDDVTITGDMTDEADNCDTGLEAVYTDSIVDGDCVNTYMIVRTWTLTDACDNVTTAQQTINVEDTRAPTFEGTLPGEITIECDAIPAAETITAIDNCSDSITVVFEESNTAGACDNEFVLVRIWTATDECGNAVSHTQTITVIDTTAPEFNEDLPSDATVECDVVPTAETLTATDNCGVAEVTFEEIITDGACTGDFIIERTWTATDTCGNDNVYTQIIMVQDTTAPALVTPFDENVTVACDDIPEIPELVFEDACSNDMEVTFNEVSTQVNDFEDYEIIRTWIVSDDCGNVDEFVQNITVEISNVINAFDNSRCIEDIEFDLFDLLSGDFDMNGTWSVVAGNATINGSLFDPSSVELGVYTFMYSFTDGPCPREIEVNVTIDDNCVVLACGKDDIVISKTVTANGDNFNEFFTIRGIEDCGFVIELQIFNRWGAEIYKSNNYQNNWNGDAHGSSVGSSGKVPTGTYYYIINLRNSGLEPFAGPIYVATK